MLQFRYGGIAYSVVGEAAFLWMTRETRRAMASGPPVQRHTAEGHTAAERVGQQVLHDTPGAATDAVRTLGDAPIPDPALLGVHEHCVYRVHPVPQDLGRDPAVDADPSWDLPHPDDPSSHDQDNGPDVIDATYRVIS
jgi:hypothetical protein